MYATVAYNGKLSALVGEIDKNGIALAGLEHAQLVEHLLGTLHGIAVQALWLDMHPNLARRALLGAADSCHYATLLVLGQKIS